MQISLNQNEIEAGVKMYVQSRGIDLNDREINMDFTAARKGNAGINVDVDLGEDATFSPADVHNTGTILTHKPGGGSSARRVPAALDVVEPTVSQVTEVVAEDPPEVPEKAEEPAPAKKSRAKAKVEPKEETATEPAKEVEAPMPTKEATPAVEGKEPSNLFGESAANDLPAPTAKVESQPEQVERKSLFG